MASSNSESSELSDNVSVLQVNESIESLMRELWAYRHDLEKKFVDIFKDWQERPHIWNEDYYNERAEILIKEKEKFLGLACSLVEKCETCQYADIIDNCDLF